jgi:transposase
MGFAVVAAAMAERIGLVEFLNARVPWDPRQCKISPGLRILALIIGCLVDPRALYRLEEFYAELDCAVLFGAERQPQDFNDDAMGRALLKLFESQVGQTFAGLSQQAVERLGLPASATAHADTTTITLYGQYPDQDAGSLPAYGYNKDGHPECKQLVAGVVARADGIPVDLDVCDGNMDDPTWTRDALLSQGRALLPEIRSQILFVADSKLLSHGTVADLCEADIYFVSRLPNSFGLERETKVAAAAAGDWVSAGSLSSRHESATYRVWETPGQVGNQTVRLVVVHSSALEAKAQARESARVADDAKRLDQAIQHWARRRFACREDALAAWETWSRTKWVREAAWTVTHKAQELSQPDGTSQWQVVVTRVAPATEVLAVERFRRSTFILVSNDPRRTARELLQAYKTQFVVEQDNALIKGPLAIAPLFLKDTKKITAYVYVVYMALLLWRCMQAVMRQNQQRWGMSLPYPHKVLQPAPTTKRLKEIVTPIQVIHWRDGAGRLHRSRSELTIVQRQALLLVGVDSRRFTQIPAG